MNTIDIIVCVLLLYALIKGWSGGIIVQVAGIVGIFAGYWASTYCSDFVAELLHMEHASHQVIYIVTLLIVMILVIMILRLLDKLLKSVGLSLPLRILGVIFSVGKWMLLLSLLLSVYLSTIKVLNTEPSKVVTESFSYKPLKYIDENIFPYISHVSSYHLKKSIPHVKEDSNNLDFKQLQDSIQKKDTSEIIIEATKI